MAVDEANIVSLVADGLEYGGWKSVRISAGIERQARDFELGITWRWPGSGAAPARIRQGSRCEVRIGADLVLTGYVYAAPVSYDARQITVSVAGRSLTSDLIDCSAARGQWRGQSIATIVTALAAPYGLSVVDQSGDGLTVADHQTEPNETVFRSIDRLLEMSALLSTDDEYGRVVIARLGSAGTATDALQLGVNVLSASAPLDFSGVFSSYECIGQRAGTDDSFGADAAEVRGEATDDRVGRYRNLTVQPSGQVSPAMAARRASWERESRMAKALQTTYEVQGWRQSDGRLWRANSFVRVRDSMIGFDRDMLVGEVEYSLDDQGMKTRLTVAPPGAYSPQPKAPKKSKGRGDSFEYLLPKDWEKS
ncbi:phage baseplate assembly protein [Castellaniella sp.]|uniref:phage baseplate assembly protein n=1 Tax=Castellaniella sp. TaxID=1955812 RepID=UPI003A90D7DC